MRDFKVPNGLSELGFAPDCFPMLANEAFTNFAATYPIEADKEVIAKIYELSWKAY